MLALVHVIWVIYQSNNRIIKWFTDSAVWCIAMHQLQQIRMSAHIVHAVTTSISPKTRTDRAFQTNHYTTGLPILGVNVWVSTHACTNQKTTVLWFLWFLQNKLLNWQYWYHDSLFCLFVLGSGLARLRFRMSVRMRFWIKITFKIILVFNSVVIIYDWTWMCRL